MKNKYSGDDYDNAHESADEAFAIKSEEAFEQEDGC